MKVLYFAWLRERLDRGSDDVEPPAGVATVSQLVDMLCARDETLAYALADRSIFKVALDARMARWDSPIDGAATLALLPPMTGG